MGQITTRYARQSPSGVVGKDGKAGKDGASGGGGGGSKAFVDLGSGTSFSADWALGGWFRLNPSGDFTVSFSNTPESGFADSIILEIVGGEGFNLTLPAGGTWGGLGEPEFSANTDIVSVGMRNGESESFWMLAMVGEE